MSHVSSTCNGSQKKKSRRRKAQNRRYRVSTIFFFSFFNDLSRWKHIKLSSPNFLFACPNHSVKFHTIVTESVIFRILVCIFIINYLILMKMKINYCTMRNNNNRIQFFHVGLKNVLYGETLSMPSLLCWDCFFFYSNPTHSVLPFSLFIRPLRYYTRHKHNAWPSGLPGETLFQFTFI